MSNEVANNAGLRDALDLDFSGIPANINPLSIMYNSSHYPISNMFQMLTSAYKTYGWIKTAVSQPVDDAFRNGLDIDSATLSEEELETLKQALEDNDDWSTIKDTLHWGRLYGGGVLIANTEQRADIPMNYKAIKNKRLEFYATDRWQASPVNTNVNVKDADFILEDVILDNSRVFVYSGSPAPWILRARLAGWGLSILEQVLPEIIRYLKAINVSLELIDEAKIDILQIDGLADVLMQDDGARKIRERVEIASLNKNYKNMLVMDSKDTYTQKQITFSGYPEMVKQIMTMVAGALRMPVAKVFGIGSTGFSSGEDDLENYNSMIESDIRVQATKLVKWVIDLRCYQLFGRALPDLKINWRSLRVLSEKDKAEIKSITLKDCLMLWDREIVSTKELAEMLKRDNILSMDIEALTGKRDDIRPSFKDIEEASFERAERDTAPKKL